MEDIYCTFARKLHDGGAHLVPVKAKISDDYGAYPTDTDAKQPLLGSWKKPPRSDDLVGALSRGHLVAIVPKSLSLAIVDVDHGNAEALLEVLDAGTYWWRSRTSGIHIPVKSFINVGHYKFDAFGCSGEIIGGNYAILWQPDAPRLLYEYFNDAYSQPRSLTGILDPVRYRKTASRPQRSKSQKVPKCQDISAYPDTPLQRVRKGARNKSLFNYVRTNCNSNSVNRLKTEALLANSHLEEPLPEKEVETIADSIARARNRQSVPYIERVGAYSPKQRQEYARMGGVKSGEVRRWQTAELDKNIARYFLKCGVKRQTARHFGVSEGKVRHVLSRSDIVEFMSTESAASRCEENLQSSSNSVVQEPAA